MRVPSGQIVEFLQVGAPDDTQMIGALRFFAGIGSAHLSLVPAALRTSILMAAQRLGDRDNLVRAHEIFGTADPD